MSVLLIVLIALSAAVAAAVPSFGKIKDGRNRGLKKIKALGWITITAYIITVGLTLLQYYLNQIDATKKEAKADSTLIKRNLDLKIKYDSSLNALKNKFDLADSNKIRTVIEALGRYSLKLDTTNKNIAIVKDSAKIRIITQNDPIVTICSGNGISLDSVKNDVHCYSISFCSESASSGSFDVLSRVVVEDSTETFRIIGKGKILDRDKLATGFNSISTLCIDGSKSYDLIFVTVEGSYKNIDNSKTYNLSEVYVYNRKNKRLGSMKSIPKKKIISFLNSHEIPDFPYLRPHTN